MIYWRITSNDISNPTGSGIQHDNGNGIPDPDRDRRLGINIKWAYEVSSEKAHRSNNRNVSKGWANYIWKLSRGSQNIKSGYIFWTLYNYPYYGKNRNTGPRSVINRLAKIELPLVHWIYSSSNLKVLDILINKYSDDDRPQILRPIWLFYME